MDIDNSLFKHFVPELLCSKGNTACVSTYSSIKKSSRMDFLGSPNNFYHGDYPKE